MVAASEDVSRESMLVRGVLDMCVLGLLRKQSRHAYGLVQALQEHGFRSVSYGTIYPLVTRLRAQGLVEQELVAGSAGPARNMLTINEDGRAALAAWTDQWRRTTACANAVLDGQPGTERAEAHANR